MKACEDRQTLLFESNIFILLVSLLDLLLDPKILIVMNQILYSNKSVLIDHEKTAKVLEIRKGRTF